MSAYVEKQLTSLKQGDSLEKVELEESTTLAVITQEKARSITEEVVEKELDEGRGTVRSLDREKLHFIRSSKTRGSFVKYYAPW